MVMNATNASSVVDYTVNTFYPALKQRLMDMATAPNFHREMMWIVIPLGITLLMMEFYFGRYSKEEIGWNTAVGNSLVLIFVCLDLLRYMYGESSFFGAITGSRIASLPAKTIVALGIGAYGFALLFFDFFHWLPKRFAFFVSSTLPINLIAYVSILIVYADLPIDLITMVCSLLIIIGLAIVFAVIHVIEPKKREKAKEEKPPEYSIEHYPEEEYPHFEENL